MPIVMNAIFILIGAVSVILGITSYTFWEDSVPGGGFMPVLAGTLLVVISVLVLLDKKHKEKTKIDIRALIPVGAIIATILVSLVIGMLPAVVVMVFAWLKWIEKYSWLKSILIALATGVVTFGIFKLWLRVPFPEGLIGKLF